MQRSSKSLSNRIRATSLIALTAASAVLSGCGFWLDQGVVDTLASISGNGSSIRVTQQMQLKTKIPVTWSVNGIPNGNAEFGTVDANGVYTAPAIVPVPQNMVTITSTGKEIHQAVGSFQVAIWNPVPVVKAITPSSFQEGSATISVSGSGFVFGARILWNGTAVETTYVSSTQLAATVAGPNPGTYSVQVVNPNPGSANSSQLAELVSPGPVEITLDSRHDSVRLGDTLQFVATVTGSSNTAVQWRVGGVAGGNAQLGTIDANGLYVPPASVTQATSLTTISATSVDNPADSATAITAVLNPVPILLSATPSSFSPGPATIILSGSNFINGAQVLVNGDAVPAVFNSSGQLTASANLSVTGNTVLQVRNPDPGAALSSDLIAIVDGPPPTPLVSPEDASRFLAQATFGATDADIHHLSQIGYPVWINEQFAKPATLHAPYVDQQITLHLTNTPPCASGDAKCKTDIYLSQWTGNDYVYHSFWAQAMAGDDQLRQRVKYALSQIFVISSSDGTVGAMPRGAANYYDVLGADSFGNFRTLMEDVTYNPMMGAFLSTMANDKGDANRDPDENFAREVMQLFTIGLYQLNPDGTQQLDSNGQPIPTYSNTDVQGLAKVFTGLSWNMPGVSADHAWSGCCEKYAGPGYGQELLPMQIYPSHHSTAEKDFLGVTIPASSQPDTTGDLKIALDTLFNHPNLPPFFCRQMIQHLVTSNPSPEYVNRVASVFRDNGTGVRGDMKAVVSAILLDDEARNNANISSPNYGRIREPLVRVTEWSRAFTAQSQSGSFDINSLEDSIWGVGEMTLRSPTVFNWFAPGYVPPGTTIEAAGLGAPEMQITDESSVVGYLNYMQTAIGSGAGSYGDVSANYNAEIALANTPDQLLARINLLLMAGQMPSALQDQILTAVNAIEIPTGNDVKIQKALLSRVQIAIFLTMASPAYVAQR